MIAAVTRTLGMPLQRIARATHVLAAGNFRARVARVSASELGQLEADFNNLAITLERNERMRAALVADVSHELRTPLAVMRGEVEALELGIREMSIDAMRSLSSELERLNRLVDDLYHLSLSDVGALQYHFGDVDIVEALEEALTSFAQPLAATNVAFSRCFRIFSRTSNQVRSFVAHQSASCLSSQRKNCAIERWLLSISSIGFHRSIQVCHMQARPALSGDNDVTRFVHYVRLDRPARRSPLPRA